MVIRPSNVIKRDMSDRNVIVMRLSQSAERVVQSQLVPIWCLRLVDQSKGVTAGHSDDLEFQNQIVSYMIGFGQSDSSQTTLATIALGTVAGDLTRIRRSRGTMLRKSLGGGQNGYKKKNSTWKNALPDNELLAQFMQYCESSTAPPQKQSEVGFHSGTRIRSAPMTIEACPIRPSTPPMVAKTPSFARLINESYHKFVSHLIEKSAQVEFDVHVFTTCDLIMFQSDSAVPLMAEIRSRDIHSLLFPVTGSIGLYAQCNDGVIHQLYEACMSSKSHSLPFDGWFGVSLYVHDGVAMIEAIVYCQRKLLWAAACDANETGPDEEGLGITWKRTKDSASHGDTSLRRQQWSPSAKPTTSSMRNVEKIQVLALRNVVIAPVFVHNAAILGLLIDRVSRVGHDNLQFDAIVVLGEGNRSHSRDTLFERCVSDPSFSVHPLHAAFCYYGFREIYEKYPMATVLGARYVYLVRKTPAMFEFDATEHVPVEKSWERELDEESDEEFGGHDDAEGLQIKLGNGIDGAISLNQVTRDVAAEYCEYMSHLPPDDGTLEMAATMSRVAEKLVQCVRTETYIL